MGLLEARLETLRVDHAVRRSHRLFRQPGPGPGAGEGVFAWPVNPPMTSTTTNAAACANNGAASFLRSTVTTGGIPSSPGSGRY